MSILLTYMIYMQIIYIHVMRNNEYNIFLYYYFNIVEYIE